MNYFADSLKKLNLMMASFKERIGSVGLGFYTYTFDLSKGL